ncbi:hypothetical protein DFS34DRAFT_594015 [Phlyctochytrium arcticum]|nr:hypothetical protein DFS34DRAFT_594015 [Phlyctochytrium arcticum]
MILVDGRKRLLDLVNATGGAELKNGKNDHTAPADPPVIDYSTSFPSLSSPSASNTIHGDQVDQSTQTTSTQQTVATQTTDLSTQTTLSCSPDEVLFERDFEDCSDINIDTMTEQFGNLSYATLPTVYPQSAPVSPAKTKKWATREEALEQNEPLSYECSLCGKTKSRNRYSSRQLRMDDRRRCIACVRGYELSLEELKRLEEVGEDSEIAADGPDITVDGETEVIPMFKTWKEEREEGWVKTKKIAMHLRMKNQEAREQVKATAQGWDHESDEEEYAIKNIFIDRIMGDKAPVLPIISPRQAKADTISQQFWSATDSSNAAARVKKPRMKHADEGKADWGEQPWWLREGELQEEIPDWEAVKKDYSNVFGGMAEDEDQGWGYPLTARPQVSSYGIMPDISIPWAIPSTEFSTEDYPLKVKEFAA